MRNEVIGVIGAMKAEIKSLRERMSGAVSETVAGMEFVSGKIGSTSVVLVQSGVGKVNAGICTQILADRFQVTHVINTGIAGSLNDRIDIGDIVVSTDAGYHDVDVTHLGYKAGEVPGLNCRFFEADPEFRKIIRDAVIECTPEIRLFEGRIMSGDQFISSTVQKQRIRRVFNAMCCEMEGAAIAQTAMLNHIPFVIVRFISDKADDSGTMDYAKFEAEAADRSARILADVLEHLGHQA